METSPPLLSMPMALQDYQVQEYEQVFAFPLLYDYSDSGLHDWDFYGGIGTLDLLLTDDAPSCHPQEGFLWDSSLWEDINSASSQKQQMTLKSSGEDGAKGGESPCPENPIVGKKTSRRVHRKDETRASRLSKEMISQYFYLPIAKAAEELKVGVTYLKKRCRELGIKRWPHRKLMSLQTLIHNVQELGKERRGVLGDEYTHILEEEKKLMEEIPDLRLDDRTKRLRQACFKANYKKRKLMGMAVSFPRKPSSSNQQVDAIDEGHVSSVGSTGAEVDDEEIKCLIEGFCSSASSDVELLKY